MSRTLPIDLPSYEALDDLCRRYEIKELAVFGSVTRDDFRDDSDVDILVEFHPGVHNGLFAFVRLQREIEEMFGRKVDLVPKDGLKPLIRDEVLASSQVIY